MEKGLHISLLKLIKTNDILHCEMSHIKKKQFYSPINKNIITNVTCSNEMSRMSKKRRCINLSNGVKIMDISHTQPKLLDAEHA